MGSANRPGFYHAFYPEQPDLNWRNPEVEERMLAVLGFWLRPGYKGRDGGRRPMQWDGSPQSGFSRGTPWLRVSRDSVGRNVERQALDPDSVFNFYRSLLRLRRASPALASGEFRAFDAGDGVLAYTRTSGCDQVVVAINFTDRARDAQLRGVAGTATVLHGSHRSAGDIVSIRALGLQPLESVILRP